MQRWASGWAAKKIDGLFEGKEMAAEVGLGQLFDFGSALLCQMSIVGSTLLQAVSMRPLFGLVLFVQGLFDRTFPALGCFEYPG